MTEALDLDARRAERGPVETFPVIHAGQTYHVPARLTVPLAVAAIRGDVPALLDGIFGDASAEVLASNPPLELGDLLAVVTRMAGGPGNLPASIGSAPGGRTSTPTT